MRSFVESIYAGKISIHQPEMNQFNLLQNVVKL